MYGIQNMVHILKAPWDEEIDPRLYLSNPDEEEYVYWKPIEKVDLDDFTEIEKAGYEYSPCNERIL